MILPGAGSPFISVAQYAIIGNNINFIQTTADEIDLLFTSFALPDILISSKSTNNKYQNRYAGSKRFQISDL